MAYSHLKINAIVGAGNILMGDDGVGVAAVSRLRDALNKSRAEDGLMTGVIPGTAMEDAQDSGIPLIEAGTDFGLILDTLVSYDNVMIIDAVTLGKKPGTLYRIPFDRAVSWDENRGFSLHDTGVAAALKQAYFLGKNPQGFILGIEPEKISPVIGLSASVESAVLRIIYYTLNLNTTTSPSFIT